MPTLSLTAPELPSPDPEKPQNSFVGDETLLCKTLIGLVIFNAIDYAATARAVSHGVEEQIYYL